jgi:hypothetical protein
MVFKGQDAWRKHPLLADCHKNLFPMFGTALKIFAAYLVIDCYVKYVTGMRNIPLYFAPYSSSHCIVERSLQSAPPPSKYRPNVKYTWDETRKPVAHRIGEHH